MNNGDGTVGFYVNGTLIDTISGGPTGFSGPEGTQLGLQVHNNTTAKSVALNIPTPIIFNYLE